MRLEREIDVNALKFRGIRIWPRLRSLLVFAYLEQVLKPQTGELKRYSTARALRRLVERDTSGALDYSHHIRHLERLGKWHAGRPLAFLGHSPRAIEIGGKRWNLIFDPLLNLFPEDKRPVRVVLTEQDTSPKPAAGSEDLQIGFAAIHRLLGDLETMHDLVLPPPHPVRGVEGYAAFAETVPEGIREAFSEPTLVKDLRYIERAALAFRILLETWRPPVVFFTGQKRINMALTLAARQLGIPTVDIQHGAAAFSPANVKWHSWTRIPDEGYELLPDYFWVWGEAAAELISRHANPRCPYHKPLVGGHPGLLADLPDVISPELRRRAQSAAKTVAVTLGLARMDGLPEPLVQAMAAAPKDWLWLLRVHPQDWKDPDAVAKVEARLQAAGISNIAVREPTEAPLEQVLPLAERHVTPYSSSAVEASAFGIPTVFVDPLAKNALGYLLEREGYAYADTADAIGAALSAPMKAPESMVATDRAAAQAILAALARGERPA